MSFEEKGTWVYLVATVVTSVVYLIIILGRADSSPLAEVSYVSTLLWTIGIAIGLSIVGHIAVAIAKPSEADKRDVPGQGHLPVRRVRRRDRSGGRDGAAPRPRDGGGRPLLDRQCHLRGVRRLRNLWNNRKDHRLSPRALSHGEADQSHQ